jgi:inorganic phosphate transporter, PiT family
MLLGLLFIATIFVAFTNGANANFKCVASLYGSGTTTLRQAALWGTATTFAGSIAALFLAKGLLAVFSGRGIVPDLLVNSPSFMCAVSIASALTSFLATRLGFPVSTTHAIIGGLLGAGLASGETVNFAALGKLFFLPLVVSPFIAMLCGALFYTVLKLLKLTPSNQEIPLVNSQQNGKSPRKVILDTFHFLCTGAASFARGLNDTPKMVALLLLTPNLKIEYAFMIVAVSIALGGLLDIDRVAETLGKKLTGMNPIEGFASSFVTSILVATASLHSLPVSTTHVSVGSLLGMGAVTKQAFWRKAAEVFVAWLSTVPCSALLAAILYRVI